MENERGDGGRRMWRSGRTECHQLETKTVHGNESLPLPFN